MEIEIEREIEREIEIVIVIVIVVVIVIVLVIVNAKAIVIVMVIIVIVMIVIAIVRVLLPTTRMGSKKIFKCGLLSPNEIHPKSKLVFRALNLPKMISLSMVFIIKLVLGLGLLRFLPTGYERLAQHYGWALGQIFDSYGVQAAEAVCCW